MTSRSRRKLPIIRRSTPASKRAERTLLAAILLSIGGVATAADPPAANGAAMLEALRERDAEQRWTATGKPRSAAPQALPPVVQPVLAPPRIAEEPTNNAAQRYGRFESTRDVFDTEPPRPPQVAIQQPALDQFEEPLAPVPMPAGDADYNPEPIAQSPDELRKIGDIMPFFDYEPDQNVDDPCLYLCPRPDGLPCKEYGENDLVPRCPDEVTLGDSPFIPRSMPPSTFAWCASNVSHHPLYFEDPALERYGHTYGDCVQPIVSLGRFSAQVISLPYHMALDPPHKEVYPLGHYRPGEPAPKLIYQVPFNAKAAVIAGGVYTGLGLVLP